MKRYIAGLLMALALVLLVAAPAYAGARNAYSRAYYTVKHHISKKKAGENLRRAGAPVTVLRRETRRLNRVIAAARRASMSSAWVSWYGPGFYGQRTACGYTMSTSLQGVAHKGLPCGSLVTLRYNGREATVPVVDRGPYAGGRTFDLCAATARALGFSGVHPVRWRQGH